MPSCPQILPPCYTNPVDCDVNDKDDDLGDHDDKRDERPTKFSALANTVRKRISGHLPEGKYWQLAPDSRRKRRKE